MARAAKQTAATWLERVRAHCLALPGVTERPSHGAPSFFVGRTKAFVHLVDDHHGDGRLALWCAATLDAQALLVNASPRHFFVPAYVGHLGWVGVRLDRGLSWKRIVSVIDAAWQTRRAPPPQKAKPIAARSTGVTIARPGGG